jgi:hypothetical protein
MQNLKEGQVLKHKYSERYIHIIALNDFKNKETTEEETFCTYYWCGIGLVGNDLAENINRDYEVYKDI